jgi:hypothetical protein
MATEIQGWPRYDARSMSEQSPASAPDAPIDPLFTHAASPFIRTEAPAPVAFASPPAGPGFTPMSTWITYKTQIQFFFAVLAFLMVLVGAVTVVEANSELSWKYYVALAPALPAGLVIWLFVRALSRLDDLQKRMQVQAMGFSMAATAIMTFGYGFFEGAGWPQLNGTLILPLMALLWGIAMVVLSVRLRFRH